jgi:hypothetical protein
MAQTGSSYLVSSDAAVGGRDTPLGLYQLCLEQALQRRIERAFFHLEQVVRSLLDVLNQRVAMGGLAAKRLKDHHFERAGEEISRWGVCHRLFCNRPRLNRCAGDGQGKFGKQATLHFVMCGWMCHMILIPREKPRAYNEAWL